ncbi:DUF512 domain-containing protein [candidate division KSB1 bacterium]|nr:DUF512 domain-containing protein [candidate division KSB1 bacterium]
MIIKGFEDNSLATEAGFKTGDDIVTINGEKVRDIIDYQYHVSEEILEIEVDRNGQSLIFEIEKDYEDNLGIIFEDFKYKHCGNKCIFCFVDQNPPQLRKSLYFKDEDFRLSFLYGNYVTLTNISKKDLQRIVEQRLSPLYVSVHSTDLEVRKIMLGIKKDDHLLEKIRFLVDHQIELHAQIVLCPFVNDGASLIKSIEDLVQFYPYLKSIAIVSLGMTKHREALYPLKPVTPSFAKKTIQQIEELAETYKNQYDDYIIYLADEFYMQAEMELPAVERYQEFPQIENGVGMVREFINVFKEQSLHLPHRISQEKSLTLVTGALAAPIIIKHVIPRLNQIENLSISLCVIQNNFYGNSVTVTGLLAGQDIFKQLSKTELGEKIILPANCLNFEGVFLDDWTPKDLEKKLDRPVEFVENDFVSLLN